MTLKSLAGEAKVRSERYLRSSHESFLEFRVPG